MEENKAKKPYNKKRHYHNHNKRSGKTRDDKVLEHEASAEEVNAPAAPMPEKKKRPQRDHSRQEAAVKQETSAPVDATAVTTERKKEQGDHKRHRNNRHSDRRKGSGGAKQDVAADVVSEEIADTSEIPVAPQKSANESFFTEPILADEAYDETPSIDPAELEEMDALVDVMILDGVEDLDLMAEENGGCGLSEDVKYEVIGVKFGSASKTYYFDPDCRKISFGEGVIVETARGDKYGKCVLGNTYVPEKHVYLPLRKVLRVATEEDAVINAENIELADAAFKQCNVKIAEHGLEMKLIDAAYTHDRSKLVFFFTAPTRVDFRELVKDLASIFKTRIDLRQIGIRDEAKMIGGYGICGRPLCCCSFLPNFNQVSIKMAKDQNLSLNTGKLSGSCGRLMCCLKFEHQTYLDEARLMPPVGSYVKTPDGNGTVLEISPVAGTLKVRVSEDKSAMPKTYKKSEVTVLKRGSVLRDGADEESDKIN